VQLLYCAPERGNAVVAGMSERSSMPIDRGAL